MLFLRRWRRQALLNIIIIVVLALGVRVLAAGITYAGDSGDPTLQDIIGVWHARENTIQSVRFEWTSTVVTPRGSKTLGLMFDDQEEHPTEDAAHQWSWQLLLDGIMLRYSSEGHRWSPGPESPGFYPMSQTTAFDGETSKRLTSRMPGPSETYPGGSILEDGRDHTNSNYHIDVLLYFCRPFDPTMGFLADTWHRQAERSSKPSVSFEKYEGERFAVVKQSFGRVRQELWTDPQRAFVISRVLTFHEDDLMSQVMVSYSPDEHVGWVPASWRGDYWIGGRLHEGYSSQMTSYQINPVIDSATFRPDFPPGSYVTDGRDGSSVFVREDGSRREVTDEELKRGATYSQIAQTEPGEAGMEVAASGWLRGTTIGSVVLLLLVAFVVCFTVLRARTMLAARN